MSRPVATRILSPKRTDNAAAVPPALRIGPAKYTATYLLPSELLLIFTPEIPELNASAKVQNGSSYVSEYNVEGFFGNLQYNYAEDMSPGNAFAADIALYYNKYLMLGSHECLLGLGLNASNIGTKISYDDGATNEFIPTNLRLGASLLVPLDEYNTISVSADINKLMVPTKPSYSDFLEESGYEQGDNSYYSEYQTWLESTGYNDISPITGIFKSFADAPGGFSEEMKEIYFGVGVEYCYNQQFSLRGGYHYENEYKGNRKYFTLGAGFRMSVFSLDAAYLISTAQSNPLDQTLRFSLSFDLDGLKDLFRR